MKLSYRRKQYARAVSANLSKDIPDTLVVEHPPSQ